MEAVSDVEHEIKQLSVHGRELNNSQQIIISLTLDRTTHCLFYSQSRFSMLHSCLFYVQRCARIQVVQRGSSVGRSATEVQGVDGPSGDHIHWCYKSRQLYKTQKSVSRFIMFIVVCLRWRYTFIACYRIWQNSPGTLHLCKKNDMGLSEVFLKVYVPSSLLGNFGQDWH